MIISQSICVLHIRPRVKVSGLKGNQFKRLAKLIYKEGKIDTNLAQQRRKTPPVADETKH
jgi:hypothetical protein